MQCESEGPTGPMQDCAKDCTEPMKQMSGGPCKAPRPGANELAAKQVYELERFVAEEQGRSNERFADKLTTELIRAREIGQREGREDQQAYILKQSATIAKLQECNATLRRDNAKLLTDAILLQLLFRA